MNYFKRCFMHFCLPIATLALSSSLLLAQQNTHSASDEKYFLDVKGRLEAIQNDKKSMAVAVNEGQMRTVFCRTCHGENGIAKRPNVPDLAGQNALYLYTQLERFSDGRRYDYMMSGLAKILSRNDLFNVSLYYSSLSPQSAGGGLPQLKEVGKQLFSARCSACHRESSKYDQHIPRIFGQQPTYVEKMLKEFRKSTGRRKDSEMSVIARGLSDQDISALASYLAGME